MVPGTHPLEELEIGLLRVAADRPSGLMEQLRRDWSVEQLEAWARANRHQRELTCEERARYRVEPLCGSR